MTSMKNTHLTPYLMVEKTESIPKMKNETRRSTLAISTQHCTGDPSQNNLGNKKK